MKPYHHSAHPPPPSMDPGNPLALARKYCNVRYEVRYYSCKVEPTKAPSIRIPSLVYRICRGERRIQVDFSGTRAKN